MKTLKNLCDPKFDLVTSITLNSTIFERNGHENPEHFAQEILIQAKRPGLSPDVKRKTWRAEILGSKNGIARFLISQNA